MGRGLPKKYAKMGFKKGWREYKASKRKTGRKSKSKRRSTPKRKTKGKRRMARGFNTQSIFKFVRIGALVLPAAHQIMSHPGDTKGALNGISQDYFGVDLNTGLFKWDRLARGWMPFIGAMVTTWGIPKIGSILRRLRI